MEEIGLSKGGERAQPRARGASLLTSLSPDRAPKRGSSISPSTGHRLSLPQGLPETPSMADPHGLRYLLFNCRGTEPFLSPAIILSRIRIPPAIL